MARETTTALTCDRCGYLERFAPFKVLAETAERPEPWGWVGRKGVAVTADLCVACSNALEQFMKNATVRPGGSGDVAASHD